MYLLKWDYGEHRASVKKAFGANPIGAIVTESSLSFQSFIGNVLDSQYKQNRLLRNKKDVKNEGRTYICNLILENVNLR